MAIISVFFFFQIQTSEENVSNMSNKIQQ